MTEQGKTLSDLANLVKAALGYDQSATKYAEDIAVRLGFDEDDSAEAITAALGQALRPTAGPVKPCLAEQVSATLVGAGFVDGENAPARAAFHVTEGVGVALGPFWANAPEAARSEQLATMAYLLETEGDISVPKRGQFLYVPESEEHRP